MSTDKKSADSDKQGAPEDIKAKFREALEKKNQHRHPHEDAVLGESKAHGEHGKAGNDKTFRRKSG